MLEILLTRYTYVAFVLLLCLGIYIVIASPNLVKKLIGLNMFQTAIFLFFISAAYVEGGSAPIVHADGAGGPFVSPLPHVLVLTAIVVGVSLTAVGLALSIRVYAEYGTLRTDVLDEVIHGDGEAPTEAEDASRLIGRSGEWPDAGPRNDASTGTGGDDR
ncbi:MAG: cation:proton antiporter subunit C [Haloferacaceae archaeon]